MLRCAYSARMSFPEMTNNMRDMLKGIVAVGADADITIYSRDVDYAKMFATPRYVLKAGTLVVEEVLATAPARAEVRQRIPDDAHGRARGPPEPRTGA